MTRMADSGATWLTLAADADKRAASLAGAHVPLTYKAHGLVRAPSRFAATSTSASLRPCRERS